MANNESEFLMRMYDQMWSNINRHINVAWQAVGVIGAAFAAFALIEKEVISYQLAFLFVIMICYWVLLHIYDAAAWCHRNLCIVSNIEMKMLSRLDPREIYDGVGKPRKKQMLRHMRIQRLLPVLIVCFSSVGFAYKQYTHEIVWWQLLACLLLVCAFFILNWKLNTKLQKANDIVSKNAPGLPAVWSKEKSSE